MTPEQLMAEFGYLALFIASFLSASALPLSSTIFLIGMPMLGYNIWLVGFVAVLGGYAGGLTTYYIGLTGRKIMLGRWFTVEPAKIERARYWFLRWGAPALLLAWLPFIGDALCATAGVLRINVWKFSAYAFIGKGWHYVVMLLIWKFWWA